MLLGELGGLVSEARNPASTGIDLMSTRDVLCLMNAEDHKIASAVGREIAHIARAVDAVVDSFQNGGRLIYVGAGTSGRLGMLDAAECPPTFGVSETMVEGIIAGGREAMLHPVERAEDDAGQGAADLKARDLTPLDVVACIAVSGRTPYVLGAFEHAKNIGAKTIALTGDPASALARGADISISPEVGPEVLTGSTRLKAGTAQKLVLNMLTTASMIRLGKCFENLMVDVRVSNDKLLARAVRIVMQATECEADEALDALGQTGNNVKLAILVRLTGKDAKQARAELEAAGGFLRRALGESANE